VDRLTQHLYATGAWDTEKHRTLSEAIDIEVRAAIKAGEAVGTLGTSKPPVSEMFEGVFKEPDWRVIEQRRELGV
jgi:2-oxoisovalerate dehydrogenase E1 component alpha subunit